MEPKSHMNGVTKLKKTCFLIAILLMAFPALRLHAQSLTGILTISQGTKSGGVYLNGSYFAMGANNPDANSAMLQAGPAGGIILGTYQNFVLDPDVPHPQGWKGDTDGDGVPDGAPGTGYSTTPTIPSDITKPFSFFGNNTYIGANPVSYQQGTSHPAPSADVDALGNLSLELSAWEVMWNGSAFEQGPRPDPVVGFVPAVGTYDAATGNYAVTWASKIVGGPFNGVTGYWHLEGYYHEDLDGDGYYADGYDPATDSTSDSLVDCDDSDSTTYPGATEICDADASNPIDSRIHDCSSADPVSGLTLHNYFADADADGCGNSADSIQTCFDTSNIVYGGKAYLQDNSTDCDDTNASICVASLRTYYRDQDGDTHGDLSSAGTDFCDQGSGPIQVGSVQYVSVQDDWDDSDPNTYPGASETCDGKDNDGNSQIDEGLTTIIYYLDSDGDGYGNPFSVKQDCSQVAPTGYAPDPTDCDDADASRHPKVAESCDGIDNDCDATVDEGVQQIYYRDQDGDGYGDPNDKKETCSDVPPAGYAENDEDCEIYNGSINPGADEVPGNGVDDNCNGIVDENNVGLAPNHAYELRILPTPTLVSGARLSAHPVDEETGQYNTSFTFGDLPNSNSNFLVDTDFRVTLDDGTAFGSGIGNDGYAGIIKFTTSPDGLAFSGSTGTSDDFHMDNVFDTAGGNFCQEYRPNQATQNSEMPTPVTLGSLHGTLGKNGSMTLIPDGRVGVVDQTAGFRAFAGARWNVAPDGEWEAFTTETASNPSGSLQGQRITENPDGTYNVTLVSPGIIGEDWGNFSGTPYVEVWKGVIVDAGAKNSNLTDDDGDGYSEVQGDCDDTTPTVFPGTTEIPYNGLDEDCSAIQTFLDNAENGTTNPDPTPDDDLDGDGFLIEEDCDDSDPAINPSAVETGAAATDGIDNNCNGRVDEPWVNLTDFPGSYAFVADPDQAHIDSGEDAKLNTYFFMGSRWKAIPGSNGLPDWIHPDFGTALKPAGLIYFTVDAGGDIDLIGQAKGPDSSGTMVYPGDYRIAKFTSPGGEYTSYLESSGTGRYEDVGSSSPGKLEFYLPAARADTQYAGTSIPFPYNPLGTEAYTNLNSQEHKGIRAQYMGTSSFDVNQDGVVDGNDRYWSVRLATAGNVPDTVPGFAGAPYGHVLSGWVVYLGSSVNTAPVADAGKDRAVTTGENVTLDSSGSSDPDAGDALAAVSWRLTRKPLGSRVVLLDPDTASPSFVPDLPGLYSFSLTVRDRARGAKSSADTVSFVALEGDSTDSDVDGFLDAEEVRQGFLHTTSDTDGDGITDAIDPFPNSALSKFISESRSQAYLVDAGQRSLTIRAGNTTGPSVSSAATASFTGQSWISFARFMKDGEIGLADGEQLPSGALALEYYLEYNLSTFRPGAAVAVTITIPDGMRNPEVYKVRNGKIVPLSSLGTQVYRDLIGGRTMTFALTDGGATDDDETVNGIIIDPIIISQNGGASSGGGGGGGGCAVAAGRGRPEDMAMVLLPIFVLSVIRRLRTKNSNQRVK